MGKRIQNGTQSTTNNSKPAITPEAKERQMIKLSMELAEKQLREGTASSQIITHYLKLGSTKNQLEKEMLEEQKKLIQAKTENMQSAKRIEELYAKAMESMSIYSGRKAETSEDLSGTNTVNDF